LKPETLQQAGHSFISLQQHQQNVQTNCETNTASNRLY